MKTQEEEWKATSDKYTYQYDNTVMELSQLEKLQSATENKVQEVTNELQRREQALSLAREELESAREKARGLEDEIQNLQSTLDKANERESATGQKVNALSQDLEAKVSAESALKEQLQQARRDASEAEDTIVDLKSESESLTEQLRAATQKASTELQAKEEAAALLVKQIELKDQELEALQVEITNRDSSIAKISAQETEVSRKLSSISIDLEVLKFTSRLQCLTTVSECPTCQGQLAS